MAHHQYSWTDYVQLVVTIILVAGFIGGAVFLVRTVQDVVASTKANLKARGYHVTTSGVQIKTDKHMDHESYLYATQRGFINGMEALKTAGSFRNAENEEKKLLQEAKAASKTAGEKEKGSRHNFKRRTSARGEVRGGDATH